LRAFLRDILFARADVTGCGIWPEPGNAIAIAAYERAGFRYLRTVTIPPQNEHAYLMYMARGELWRDVFAGGSASALHGAAPPRG
jgi:RimJ/RimL family protein N-acetyltransferase